MTEPRCADRSAPDSASLARRLAGVTHALLASLDRDDLDEALRLTEERGRLIAELASTGTAGSGLDPLLREARDAGRNALSSATRRAAELHEELASLDTGRSSLSAYDPGSGGGSLDVSR